MAAGSVTVDDSGTATGDGDALALYTAMLAAETAVSPFPDPENPPDDYVGNQAQWAAAVTPQILKMKRAFARIATYHASVFHRDPRVRTTNVTGAIAADEEFLVVGSHSPGITLTVPAGLPVGRAFEVKDAVGEGATKPITVAFSGGETVDGSGTIPTTLAYQCLSFVKITSALWSVRSAL